MNARYYKRANIAAAVWLISLAMLGVFSVIFFERLEDLDKNHPAMLTAIVVQGLSYFGACWYFAKAKGYWGILGLTCAVFSVIGLGVLLGLEDRDSSG